MKGVALAGLLVAAALAPASSPRAAQPAVAEERAVVEVATAVAEAHEQADKLAGESPRAAAGVLERALQLRFPSGERARALRAELFGREAELLLKAGDAAAALAVARRGLAEEAGKHATAFTAQLELREAEALEAQGDDAAAVGAYRSVIVVAKQLLAQRGVKEHQ